MTSTLANLVSGAMPDLSPALGTAMVRANFAPARLSLRGGRQ